MASARLLVFRRCEDQQQAWMMNLAYRAFPKGQQPSAADAVGRFCILSGTGLPFGEDHSKMTQHVF